MIEVCILKPVSLDEWYTMQQQLINAIQKHIQAMEVDQTLNLYSSIDMKTYSTTSSRLVKNSNMWAMMCYSSHSIV